MIVVRIELWSAVTGKITELGRAEICNEGVSDTGRIRDYGVRTLKGRDTKALNRRITQRDGKVTNYPAVAIHVWHLVSDALKAMGYDNRGKKP